MLIRARLSRRGVQPTARGRGFTLVELMVTLTLLAILMLLAAPSFTEMTRNSQVRSVADALQNGLRAAQTEAVRRNRQVVFTLTNDTPGDDSSAEDDGRNWAIHSIPRASETGADPVYVQGGHFASTAENVAITGPAAICFNSMGRLVANSATGVTGAACALAANDLPSYTVRVTGATRPLQVNVGLGGQLRMCDPAKALSADTPDGCVAAEDPDDDDPTEAPDTPTPIPPETTDTP